ncbi:hypothetical protein EYF80_023422 [Liparis tanakae]|uniref:Uncharacterized protein n=1 Tax=Liparis tanakae TaxID=230148 RepID=A0A4Z2HN39_9TELE|nr:hypothetical protein EYF80_023422 [Liparis tanakae]
MSLACRFSGRPKLLKCHCCRSPGCLFSTALLPPLSPPPHSLQCPSTCPPASPTLYGGLWYVYKPFHTGIRT